MNRTLSMMVAAALVPGALRAQGTAPSWPGLASSGLSTVYVLDDTGVETSGKLIRLNADSLVLLVGDVERHFDAARVRRIEKRGDSLRNGMLTGAVLGVLMGLIGARITDCPGADPGGSCPGFRVATLLGSIGGYTSFGAGIDALIVVRTRLYEAPVPPPASLERSTRAPFHRRAGVNLSFRW